MRPWGTASMAVACKCGRSCLSLSAGAAVEHTGLWGPCLRYPVPSAHMQAWSSGQSDKAPHLRQHRRGVGRQVLFCHEVAHADAHDEQLQTGSARRAQDPVLQRLLQRMPCGHRTYGWLQ